MSAQPSPTLAFPKETPTQGVQRWPSQGQWSYDDYARLPDNGMRYEVINGELFMSPAPRPKHQRIILKLAMILETFAETNALGEVYQSPIDLNIPGLASPVQPDILFIRQENLEIVKEQFIEGVPDLIVEVLSPGNPLHDRRIKFQLYAQAAVPEYWIIEPETCLVTVFILRGNAYVPLGTFGADESIRSEFLPTLTIAVNEIC